ncbi:hypothetical protein ACFTSF_27300 [Kribbella sp. NPDC056951]|uniref:hypothetical protein n=1 Tax=Kribbella sp. NPDC056951 TaxID=3345978 RepID=UPI00362B1ED6
MADLPYEANKFTSLNGPASGTLPVSMSRLVRAAMSVGATPIAMGGHPRPLIELLWRGAMVQASLQETSGHWYKAPAYKFLDPSEKTAVSYFLGMTQAKISCELLLGVPHLIHLDSVLQLLGAPTRTSRPDLVGYDAFSRQFSISVEAKGRSGGWFDNIIDKAKDQARLMPAVVGPKSNVCVASLAYFGSRGRWEAYLEDPPKSNSQIDDIQPSTLLVGYYRPLVAAMFEAGISESERSDAEVVTNLPGLDAKLGLPEPIVRALADIPRTGFVAPAQVEVAGSQLIEEVGELFGRAEMANELHHPDAEVSEVSDEPRDPWEPVRQIDAEDPTTSVGLDGVRVTLGPSWFRDRQL